MRSIYVRLLSAWLMSAVLLLGHCVDCLKTRQAAAHSCCHKEKPQPTDNTKPACPVDQVLVQEAKDSVGSAAVIPVRADAVVQWIEQIPSDFAANPPISSSDRSILNHVLRI